MKNLRLNTRLQSLMSLRLCKKEQSSYGIPDMGAFEPVCRPDGRFVRGNLTPPLCVLVRPSAGDYHVILSTF